MKISLRNLLLFSVIISSAISMHGMDTVQEAISKSLLERSITTIEDDCLKGIELFISEEATNEINEKQKDTMVKFQEFYNKYTKFQTNRFSLVFSTNNLIQELQKGDDSMLKKTLAYKNVLITEIEIVDLLPSKNINANLFVPLLLALEKSMWFERLTIHTKKITAWDINTNFFPYNDVLKSLFAYANDHNKIKILFHMNDKCEETIGEEKIYGILNSNFIKAYTDKGVTYNKLRDNTYALNLSIEDIANQDTSDKTEQKRLGEKIENKLRELEKLKKKLTKKNFSQNLLESSLKETTKLNKLFGFEYEPEEELEKISKKEKNIKKLEAKITKLKQEIYKLYAEAGIKY